MLDASTKGVKLHRNTGRTGRVEPTNPVGAVLARIAVDDALTLLREPDNPHDQRAVRVEWNGVKLGYVPRAHNADIAQRMDGGEILHATINELQHDHEVWSPVQMVATMVRG